MAKLSARYNGYNGYTSYIVDNDALIREGSSFRLYFFQGPSEVPSGTFLLLIDALFVVSNQKVGGLLGPLV